MRLTAFTDYTLRVLLYLAEHRDRTVTVHDIATWHGLSHHHLTKVVHALGRDGLVETIRGRNGGLRLRIAPSAIRIGDVVRLAEHDFHIAECFDHDDACIIGQHCGLKSLLVRATNAFLAELDAATLEQLANVARTSGRYAGLPSAVRLTLKR